MPTVSKKNPPAYHEPMERRSRFAPPQPGLPFALNDVRLAVLHALDRHRRLPTPYLQKFIARHATDYKYAQDLLTQLYNGYCEHPDHRAMRADGHVCRAITFISRHWLVIDNATPAIYSLSPNGQGVIESEPRIASSASPVHDLFASCLTASFELQANAFVSRGAVFSRAPEETQRLPAPFDIPAGSGAITPDDFFLLGLDEGGYRAFALEADRATERVYTRNSVPSSIAKKITQYGYIFENGIHRKRFNAPHLSVLFATTSAGRIETMLRHVKENVPSKYRSRFLFKHFADFGEAVRVPRELLDVMSPWQSVDGPQEICKKAAP